MRKSSSRTNGPVRNERGSSSVKFIIVLIVVAVLVYMGVQYVPVAYKYSSYKTYMQDSVDKAVVTGQGPEWVRTQLVGNEADYGVPKEAKIMPTIKDGKIVVTVQFTQPINLLPGIWTYIYNFDHTATSRELGKF
ncbi:MAG TPA: hypothetical protein VKB86_13840 [Pyrinomonadaceae bacterium]|nr:hypothetical protein [Pyrinomonadaceae bacterium]